jgi:hypothetical protein
MSDSLVDERPWLQSNLGYTTADQKEIVYRVDAVKRELFSAVLAAQGDALSLNGLINHISILIQLPIICLVYNKDKELYQTFDLKKFRASRSSKIMVQGREQPIDTKFTKKSATDNNPSLFKIYDSSYYLRVFLLSPSKTGDGSFIEIPQRPLPQKKSFTKLEKQQEYIRIMLNGFLDFSSDIPEYGDNFIEQIQDKIKNIIASNSYAPPAEGRRQITTLSHNIDSTKEFISNRLADMVGEQHGLDRVYRRTSFAGRAIKNIGVNVDVDGLAYPNILFSFRVYDRTHSEIRAERDIDGERFNGYTHSVSITIPFQQEQDIIRFFSEMNKSYDGERYGEDWSFQQEELKKSEDKSYINNFDAAYKSISKLLDDVFWRKISSNDGRKEIVEILKSPVGKNSTSMIDAAFYYGSVIYRMPFRKLGGLSRLHNLEEMVDRYLAEGKEFSTLKDIEIDAELYKDCLRVVAFFYLTRMLGPMNFGQKDCWTRISIFPIEVATSIIGAISCVSYEKKEIKSYEKLPVDNREWRQEFYFFTEIVGAAQRVLRLQYRDFQIDVLCEVFAEEFRKLLINSVMGNDGYWNEEMLNSIANRLNIVSRMISRISPWPAYKFTLVPLDSIEGVFDGVVAGEQFGVIVQNEKSWDVFRVHHEIPGFSEISKENKKSLLTKIEQKIKLTIDTFKATPIPIGSNAIH